MNKLRMLNSQIDNNGQTVKHRGASLESDFFCLREKKLAEAVNFIRVPC